MVQSTGGVFVRLCLFVLLHLPSLVFGQTQWNYGKGVCKGRWVYQRYNMCPHIVGEVQSRRPECGVQSSKNYYSRCRHENHGVEYYGEKVELEQTSTRTVYKSEEYATEAEIETICKNYALEKYPQYNSGDHYRLSSKYTYVPKKIKDDDGPDFDSPIRDRDRSIDSRSSSLTAMDFQVDYQCFVYMQAAVYKKARSEHCPLKHVSYTYKKCFEKHLTKQLRSQKCGSASFISQSGASINQIPKIGEGKSGGRVEFSAFCSTGDGLADGTPDQVAIKVNKLLGVGKVLKLQSEEKVEISRVLKKIALQNTQNLPLHTLSEILSYLELQTESNSCDLRYQAVLGLCKGTAQTSFNTSLCVAKFSQGFLNIKPECKEVYKKPTFNAVEKMLAHQFSKVKQTNALAEVDEVGLLKVLRNVNAWLNFVNREFPKDLDDQVLKLKALYFKHSNSKLTNVIAQLDVKKVFMQHTQVIGLALRKTDKPIFAVSLLADLVAMLHERINLAAKIEDLYCLAEKCYENKNFLATSLEESVKVLANIFEFHDSENDELAPLLKVVQPYRETINKVLKEVELNDVELLKSHLHQFKLMAIQKQNTGLFEVLPQAQISFGFDNKFKISLIQRADRKLSSLNNSIQNFATNHSNLLYAARDSLQSDSQYASLLADTQILRAKQKYAIKQINSIENFLAEQQGSLARYLRSVESSEGVLANYFSTQSIIDSQGSQLLTVAATDAKYTDEVDNQDIAELAFHHFEAGRGSVVSLSASGRYSPLCALRKSEWANKIEGLSAVTIGPTGFVINESASKTVVQSMDFGWTMSGESTFSGKSYCLDRNPNTENCNVKAGTTRNVDFVKDSTGDQHQHSMSAHFARGLRLQGTPFEDFPAGATLAVVMPKDSNRVGDAKEVYVVHPNSKILIRSDSTVYLVLNDCVHPINNNRNKVTIGVKKTIGLHQGKNMILHFLEALREMQTKGLRVETKSSIKVLMQEVVKKYTMAATNHTFGGIDKLRELFEYWLQNEALKIEKRIELRSLDLQLNNIELQLKKISEEYKNKSIENQLQDLRVQRLLLNSDQNLMINDLSSVINFFQQTLLPVVQFHYPHKSIEIASHGDIPSIQIFTNSNDLAHYTQRLVKQFIETLNDNVAMIDRTTNNTYAAIRFPKPGATIDRRFQYGTVANKIRSKYVWDAFLSNSSRSIIFDISVNDLYRYSFSGGSLSCNASRPILIDMGLFFVVDSRSLGADEIHSLNDVHHASHMVFSPRVKFADDDGVIEFRYKHNSRRSNLISVMFIDSAFTKNSAVLLSKKLFNQSTGIGLTPFSKFKIDRFILNDIAHHLDSLAVNGFKDIKEIMLVFRVQTTSIRNNSSWLKNCTSF